MAVFRLTYAAGRCTGCLYCEAACRFYHAAASGRGGALAGVGGRSALAAGEAAGLSRIRIDTDPLRLTHRARFCRRCQKPACVAACGRGAIVVDARHGWPVVRREACDGCGDCIRACPSGGLHASGGIPAACDCRGRPRCVAFCCSGALCARARRHGRGVGGKAARAAGGGGER